MQPGKVAVMGRIVPHLDVRGRENLTRFVTQDARTDIHHAIQLAGYAGHFVLHVNGKGKGTAHTKGVRIKNVEHGRVRITCQMSDNSSCVECLLVIPDRTDIYRFYSSFKTAFEQGETPKEPESASEGNIVRLHPEKFGVERAPVAVPPQQDDVSLLREISAESLPAGHAHVGFLNRADDVELFMMAVGEQANEDGLVSIQACKSILMKDFNFANAELTKYVFRVLREKSYFLPAPIPKFYKVSPRYYNVTKSKPAPSAETAPPREDTGLVSKIAQLEAEVAASELRAESLRVVLAGLADERSGIESKLSKLQDDLAKVNDSEASLRAELETLTGGNTAKQRLEQIRALLRN